MEKDQVKFPNNQATVAGTIAKAVMSEDRTRLNLDVEIPHGEKQAPRYLRVYINGADRVQNFENAVDKFIKLIDSDKSLQDPAGKPVPVPVMFKGTAFFQAKDGNTNFSCLIKDDLSKNSEKFFLPSTKEELEKFNKTYTEKSYDNTNNVKIFGRLTSEPKVIETAKGKFAEVSIAHNYSTGSKEDKQNEVMFAKVIIPSSKLETFLTTGYEKGTAVNLDASIQPRAYENSKGEKKYTVNLVTNNIAPDLSKVISKGAAIEMAEDLAQTSKKSERQEKVEELKENLTSTKSKSM